MYSNSTKDSAILQIKIMKGNIEADGDSSAQGKSISTSFASESGKPVVDQPVDQVDENHYVYRKGETKIHVQTLASPITSDVIDEDETENVFLTGISLFSTLIGLIMAVISFGIKLAAAITNRLSDSLENQYMLAIYLAGFVWTAYYNLKGIFRHRNRRKFSKSNQSSNRWLKGVVVLFGLAIVLRDGLVFITFVMVNTSICVEKQTEATLAFFHALFIISQVQYIFRFSKVFIHNSSSGSRIGLMFIIALNLSTWIALIVDETLIAFAEEHKAEEEEDFCRCVSPFCEAVDVAVTFLFPFEIEFSLVASCLLYVTWSNIGKQFPLCEVVVKPSYKFYNKYTGAASGTAAFFLTIVFLILLGTSGINIDPAERNYFTENHQLLLHDGFLMGLEFIMLLVTIFGFYLFHKIRRPLAKASMLDQVLLAVCILGPLTVNIFSLIAVVIGPDNKTVTWILTLLRPLVDVLQCLFQLIFILFGLKREPLTSGSSNEMEEQHRFGMGRHIRSYVPNVKMSTSDDESHINKTYLQSPRNSDTSFASTFPHSQFKPTPEHHAENLFNAANHHILLEKKHNKATAGKIRSTLFNHSEVSITQSGAERMTSRENEQTSEPERDGEVNAPQHIILKIVSETKVARPDELRSWLRDVIFFLLMTNASLWLFQSLSETAFIVYPYESIFYGTSAWTTIVMICRPLSIFFRMHSAGCLFEMWSFA